MDEQILVTEFLLRNGSGREGDPFVSPGDLSPVHRTQIRVPPHQHRETSHASSSGICRCARTSLSAQSSMLEPADASRRFCAASPNSRCSSSWARRGSLSRQSPAHGNTPAPTCRWACTSPTIPQLEADTPLLARRERCPEGFGQWARPIEQMMWGGAISAAS